MCGIRIQLLLLALCAASAEATTCERNEKDKNGTGNRCTFKTSGNDFIKCLCDKKLPLFSVTEDICWERTEKKTEKFSIKFNVDCKEKMIIDCRNGNIASLNGFTSVSQPNVLDWQKVSDKYWILCKEYNQPQFRDTEPKFAWVESPDEGARGKKIVTN